jgi:hypothetical protein
VDKMMKKFILAMALLFPLVSEATLILDDRTNVINIAVTNTGDTLNFNSDISQTTTNLFQIQVASLVVSGGVSSITGTSAVEGAVTFTGDGVSQSGNTFNFSGGGGGGLGVSNFISTSLGLTISNDTTNVYFSLGDIGLGFGEFTNSVTYNFTGTNGSFTVPAGVTQIVAYIWGGGGFGAFPRSSGYTEIFMETTPNETLTLQVGEGSIASPVTNATGISISLGGWPDGGVGVTRNNIGATGSGAGSSRFWRGTNLIAIAGGASGAAAFTALGGAGGGVSGSTGGQSGTGAVGGGGGSQTLGGATGSTAVPLSWTNTAGSFLQGGDGGANTNSATGSGGGGGGGYYGGGGGLAGTAASSVAGGGGGSGYYNPDLVIFGTTLRTDGTSPAGIDLPWYGTDAGGFGWGTGRTTGTRGAHGAIVIRHKDPAP